MTHLPKQQSLLKWILSVFALLTAVALFSPAVSAQSTHSVTLVWVDGKNPAGVTYTVYRATGLCSGTPTFAKLATALATLTYVDSTATPGNYCYEVTATVSGMESAPSNTVGAPVPAFSPSGLQVTVQ